MGFVFALCGERELGNRVMMFTQLREVLGDGRVRIFLILGVTGAAALAILFVVMGWDLGTLRVIWMKSETFLRDNPWWLFAALVILPGLPVPTSALLFLTGTVWRGQPAIGCVMALSALALNMSWCYWLARGPARGFAARWFVNLKLPELSSNNCLKTILLLRLTPGFPFFVQNYLLGFLKTPFPLYLGVSMLCNGFISIAVVLAGAGLAGGNFGTVITGVSLVVVVAIVVKWVRDRYALRSPV